MGTRWVGAPLPERRWVPAFREEESGWMDDFGMLTQVT
jgi:hypothetical protein